MDASVLSKEISQMHIDNARLLTKISNAFSTSGEQGVLLWLWQRTTETYAIDIIDHFGLTPGRVANIVKKLLQRGYIERIQDTEDQRKARITVTQSGAEYAQELFSHMNAEHLKIIDALGEKDTQEWVRLLKRMIIIAEDDI